MSSPLLEIVELSVEGRTPGGVWVPTVRDISVSVSRGEVVALIGESGAGKTTVALAALSYVRPGTRVTAGKVTLEGVDILSLSARKRRAARGRYVAYVAQSAQAALNPAISIGEQVAEPLLLHGIATAKEAGDRAIALLQLLDLPSPREFACRYPHQASGGEQQRVMVAMALACAPKLLVLDEPTTALDATSQIEVLKAVKDAIRDHGSAAIYVSHDLAVVAQVADRIVVMKDGMLIEEGLTSEILERPKADYTRELIRAAKPRQACERDRVILETQGAPVLGVDRISATYERQPFFGSLGPETDVLHAITFDVLSREVVALVGESGSGKSTLARVAAGLHSSREGTVYIGGQAVASRTRKRERDLLRRVQIIFQSPDLSLNPEQRVETIIGRPIELYFGLTARERTARVAELLTMVGLSPDYAGRFPAELSGGQRQRVSIARAFAAKPDLVLCDEILSSLDTIIAAQVLQLMSDLRSTHNVAYLFVSHDLSRVASIADRVIVLYAGRVMEIGPTASVFSPPHHPYTALLLSSIPALRAGWLEEMLASQRPTRRGARGPIPHDIGCPFRTRCPLVIDGTCDSAPPPARLGVGGGTIYCHREIDELAAAQPRHLAQVLA
jgi:peptide/nickel transport system ATP-binding protein